MVEPAGFYSNPETRESNVFQTISAGNSTQSEVQKLALKEFLSFQAVLESNGINILKFKADPLAATPDALFPNNWIGQLPDQRIFIFPMLTQNRRREVRQDIVEKLKSYYPATPEVIDLRDLEKQNLFLEGTGSLIFDHSHKIAYAGISSRTSAEALKMFSELSGYRIISFQCADSLQREIYHTNVMMALSEKLAVLNLSAIQRSSEKETVLQELQKTGKRIIDISHDQMLNFCGNLLFLQNSVNKKYWVGSSRAWESLSNDQQDHFLSEAEFLHAPLKTIEDHGGGGARCLMAEVFI